MEIQMSNFKIQKKSKNPTFENKSCHPELVSGFFLPFILLLFLSPMAYALPSYDEVQKSYVKSDSLLLDRNGEVLHELRTDKVRRRLGWTSLNDISPALRVTVVKAEDKRFYEHSGVDYRSVGAAVIQGLTSESLRGASTITMQLASLLDRELQPGKDRKSLWQKGKQVVKAWEIEKSWSKQEILEAYLNLVTFRGELQGIASASRGLFGKDPHGLDQSESLILASLIRSPNASSSEVLKRTSHLNGIMDCKVDGGEIYSKVRQIFLGSNVVRSREGLAPHVARQLLKREPYGTAMRSTLDIRTQRFVRDLLVQYLHPLRLQNVRDGAVLVVENRTGDVLAYVSYSGEPSAARFVDGVHAKRQAGSTLKPFLYGLAFDQRILTPASLLEDSPLDIAVLSGIYQPRNYDAQFRGLVTSRAALASSLNVPAVKTLSLVGTEAFLTKLRQLGIKGLNESGDFYGPSLALGSADVSLWELVNAYRALANEGEWTEIHLALERKGPGLHHRVFSREAVFLVSEILSDRESRSPTFGLENPLATRFWTAVKTGTSKDMRDNWCIGFSGKYTVGVWIGNFSGDAMWNVSGVSGAAPIWVEAMNFLHRNDLGSNPIRNSVGALNHAGSISSNGAGIVKREVQFTQGIATAREEWFIRGTEPDSKSHGTGQFNPKIVYPPAGTVIALDPDIPGEAQKVFFVSQTDGGLQWVLNGEVMNEVGKAISWTPRAGKYSLAIAEKGGDIVDSVHFEVRGPGGN